MLSNIVLLTTGCFLSYNRYSYDYMIILLKGEILWQCSELISLKSVSAKRSTASEREWLPQTAEKFYRQDAEKAESSLPIKILKSVVVFSENRDFRRLYHQGKAIRLHGLIIYYKKNHESTCRMGITVSKKTGNAVERNRSKRIIRAAFRQILPCINGNFDFIFVARSSTKTMKSTDIYDCFVNAFGDEGILTKKIVR